MEGGERGGIGGRGEWEEKGKKEEGRRKKGEGAGKKDER